jgi:hypothetical protein
MASETRQDAIHKALAEAAARKAGLEPATAQAAAENEDARAIRDELWRTLHLRLVDVKTYTLDQIVEWMREVGATGGSRTGLQRQREAAVAREGAYKQRAELARRTVEQLGDTGETDVARAGRAVAMQLLFESLRGLGPEALAELSPAGILQMCNTLAVLGKLDVETQAKAVQLSALRKAAKEAVDAAAAKKNTGIGLTRDDVYAIIDDVMSGK